MSRIVESLYRVSGISLNEEDENKNVSLREIQEKLKEAQLELNNSNLKAICVGFSNGKDRWPLDQKFNSMEEYYIWRDKVQAGWRPKLEFYTVYKNRSDLALDYLLDYLYDDFISEFEKGRDWEGNFSIGRIKCDDIQKFKEWFDKNNIEYNYFDLSQPNEWTYSVRFKPKQ